MDLWDAAKALWQLLVLVTRLPGWLLGLGDERRGRKIDAGQARHPWSTGGPASMQKKKR